MFFVLQLVLPRVLIVKTESAERMLNMFRGFKNPKWFIMEKVAKKHSEKALEQMKINSSKITTEKVITKDIKSAPITKKKKC